MAEPKETNFFQHNYHRGFEWFESLFEPSQKAHAFGEASPGNMIHSSAAERISDHFPEARLIFVLRDPVERAYSQYCFGVMRGTQDPSQSFSELIRSDDGTWGDRVLRLGLYYRQLTRFEKHFPRNQMAIHLFQDFRRDNEAFVRRLFKFLDVDESVEIDTSERHNRTRYPRSKRILKMAHAMWAPVKSVLPKSVLEQMYGLRSSVRELLFQSGTQEKPPMKSEDRAYLRDYYAEPNERLEDWLGRDLSHWT
ncbi:hypothetical protein GGP44_003060 [Salinibacter ruber]|nr:hypothetical protein [Salinibacter ruber]